MRGIMSKIPFYFETPVPQYFRKNGWFKKPNCCAFVTWAFSRCSVIEKEIWHDGKKIILKPYQFIFGRNVCSEETGLTDREIRTQQKNMELSGFLQKATNKTTNRFTIYEWVTEAFSTIGDQQNDQKTTNKRPQTRTENKISKETTNKPLTPSESEDFRCSFSSKEDQLEIEKEHAEHFQEKIGHVCETSPSSEIAVVFSCMAKISDPSVTQKDKEDICRKYTESQIQLAVTVVTHSTFTPTTTLLRSIYAALKGKWALPVDNSIDIEKNMELATKVTKIEHAYTFEKEKDGLLIIKGVTGTTEKILYAQTKEKFREKVSEIGRIDFKQRC